MLGKEPNQTATLPTRVESFFHCARSALSEHVAGFGQRVDAFLGGLRAELEQARGAIEEFERKHAGRFNVFAFIEPDENRLSDILADLLDPKGSHGQGGDFLRLLADQLRVPIPVDVTRAKVYREETTAYIANPLRRIDIVVDFGTFGLAIENKPWAGEQARQVRDYLDHLRGRYGDRFVLVYLSGAGIPPKSVEPSELERLEKCDQYRLLDYGGGLSAWLGKCVDACEAESVQWFLRHFHGYVMKAAGWAAKAEGAGQ